MDEDLDRMSRDDLLAAAKAMRAAIREHRDSSGHDLCWHHPKLWQLLPEPLSAEIAVPAWPQFLHGCLKYREALERELAGAPVHRAEYE